MRFVSLKQIHNRPSSNINEQVLACMMSEVTLAMNLNEELALHDCRRCATRTMRHRSSYQCRGTFSMLCRVSMERAKRQRQTSSAKTVAPKRSRKNGRAKTVAPKRSRQNPRPKRHVPDQNISFTSVQINNAPALHG